MFAECIKAVRAVPARRPCIARVHETAGRGGRPLKGDANEETAATGRRRREGGGGIKNTEGQREKEDDGERDARGSRRIGDDAA